MPYNSETKRKAWYQANRKRLIAYSSAYNKSHPDQRRVTARTRYANNPDKFRKTAREYRKAHPERARAVRVKAAYGLTYEQLTVMFVAQGSHCKCCGATEPHSTNWNVDHDHITGEVRGILCGLCNVGIGALGDNLAGVTNAVMYLDSSAPHVDEHW